LSDDDGSQIGGPVALGIMGDNGDKSMAKEFLEDL
jgi:hypothetical protein